jgi:hypothetical protein
VPSVYCPEEVFTVVVTGVAVVVDFVTVVVVCVEESGGAEAPEVVFETGAAEAEFEESLVVTGAVTAAEAD